MVVPGAVITSVATITKLTPSVDSCKVSVFEPDAAETLMPAENKSQSVKSITTDSGAASAVPVITFKLFVNPDISVPPSGLVEEQELLGSVASLASSGRLVADSVVPPAQEERLAQHLDSARLAAFATAEHRSVAEGHLAVEEPIGSAEAEVATASQAVNSDRQ